MELPLSFRQKWNNPFELTDPALNSPKKNHKKQKKQEKQEKQEEKQVESKKLSVDELLDELSRNCELAIKAMQELKTSISNIETRTEPPGAQEISTYADVPIPKDIPEHIRQHFFDAEYAFQEILVLRKKVPKQLLRVRSTLVAWHSTSQEVWYVRTEAMPSHFVLFVLRSEARESSLWEKLVSLFGILQGRLFYVRILC